MFISFRAVISEPSPSDSFCTVMFNSHDLQMSNSNKWQSRPEQVVVELVTLIDTITRSINSRTNFSPSVAGDAMRPYKRCCTRCKFQKYRFHTMSVKMLCDGDIFYVISKMLRKNVCVQILDDLIFFLFLTTFTVTIYPIITSKWVVLILFYLVL